MINKDELEKKKKGIQLIRKELSNELPKLREFLNGFPKDKIKLLKKEEYVVGFGRTNTFCYWLENKLGKLGNIHGSPARKFGIYFDKKNYKYAFLKKKFGTDENEVFDNIKNEIINLLDAGEKDDLETIKNSKLSPMFRGKILSTYFPDKYLNIFSDEHLTYFLNELGIRLQHPEDSDEIDKRIILTAFKDKDPIMEKWTKYEFSGFLYKFYRPPKNIGYIKILNDIKNLKEQDDIIKRTRGLTREEMIDYFKSLSLNPTEKVVIKAKSYKRNNVAIAYIKKIRGFKCQFCGSSILKKNGDLYIEAAHITPKHKKGSELPENILILCPNHHKEFDLGKRTILRMGKEVIFKLNDKEYKISFKLE